jgi:phosphate transport system substrate-binding protein
MKISSITLAALLAGISTAASAQSITGAGSTFAGPLYDAWAKDAKADVGVELNYQMIGSGAGLNQIKARTVDFGGTDAPLAADKLAALKEFQFPTAIGAIVPVVNIPGIKPNQLKLSGAVLAGIYMGDITDWNDPKIAALNPGVTLPDLAIAPVHRADGSGTTFVFTSYLSAVSPDWKSKIGAATSVSWPLGAGAKGNPGVAGTVGQVAGAIGYVEYVFAAKSTALTTTMMQNAAGAYVVGTPASFMEAASSADWAHAQNFVANMLNTPGISAWPIVTATYAVLPEDPKDASKSLATLKLFDWGFSKGNDIAVSLYYIPLPTAVEDNIRAAWKTAIKGPDGAAIWK